MSINFTKNDMNPQLPATMSNYNSNSMPPTGADTGPGMFARVARVLNWVADMPRRRAVMAELNNLSDHELADIGLSRSEMARVFDPDFAAERAAHRASMGQTITV